MPSTGGLPLVSVVVATVDDHDLTAECLTSLLEQTHRPLEIILVCNGTPPDVVGRLRSEFPAVLLVELQHNRGFAGGFNEGMRRATAAHVAIINNDAIAAPDWVHAMLVKTASADRVGAVACTVLRSDDPERLDSQGLGIAVDGMSRQLHRGRRKDHSSSRAPLIAHGCAALFTMDALREVGLFDESFFAYCEDADLGLRLLWAGYTTALARDAEVTHRYSMTTGRFSSQKVFWVERNHLWVALKCLPWPLLVLLPVTTAWRFVLQLGQLVDRSTELSHFASSEGSAAVARSLLKAYGSAALGAPRCLRQRVAIQRAARVSTRDMTRLLWKRRLAIGAVLSEHDK